MVRNEQQVPCRKSVPCPPRVTRTPTARTKILPRNPAIPRQIFSFARLASRTRAARTDPRHCLFVANHTSSADAPAVVGAYRGDRNPLKKSLFNSLLSAAFISRIHSVERSKRDSAIEALRKPSSDAHRATVLNPEGTRTRWDGLRIKKGAVVMAIKRGTDCADRLFGAHRVMEKRPLVFFRRNSWNFWSRLTRRNTIEERENSTKQCRRMAARFP